LFYLGAEYLELVSEGDGTFGWMLEQIEPGFLNVDY